MQDKLFRKVLVLTIIVLFVGAGVISSVGRNIVDKQQTETQNFYKPSEEILNPFYMFMDRQENLNINPLMKKLIKQAVASGDDIDLLPGFYKFNPCDPIDIQGVGTLSRNETIVIFYLHEGAVNLNNSFSGEYIGWEIAALGTFGDFSGECNGSTDFPFKPLSVDGRSEYALLMESSYMLEMSVKNEKYRRGVEIPVTIKRLVFPYMKLRDIKLVNPHFYVFMFDEETEKLNVVYEEELQETWELPLLGSKTWKWDQKDKYGNQVPYGNYSFVGEFEIDGIVHPVFGPGVEIGKIRARNIKNPQMLLCQILEKFSSAFPILRQLLRL
jgi:hypothetical protein